MPVGQRAAAHITRVGDGSRCQHCAPVYGICSGLAGGKESHKDDKCCPERVHPADEDNLKLTLRGVPHRMPLAFRLLPLYPKKLLMPVGPSH